MRAASLLVSVLLAPSIAAAYVTDADVHPPPSSGPYAYDAFTADAPGFIGPGERFVDPVFDESVQRVTNERAGCGQNQLYARNGFWNADGTLLLHQRCDGTVMIDTATGAVAVSRVPGSMTSASFDPIDPDLFWFVQGTRLMRFVPSTGATSEAHDFGAPLGNLGSSVDFVDASGRWFLVELPEGLRVYDREASALYEGAITDPYGAGWAGLSPDGRYVVLRADDSTARSYAIDRDARRVASAGTIFWNLCGDHSDVISASDGRTYLVGFECYDEAAIYRIDVTLDLDGASPPEQRDANRRLFDTDWPDSGHFSCISSGPLRDWCAVSMEDSSDTLADAGTWRPYRNEIVLANVVTGEVRRLAHHRSRDMGGDYFRTPRVSASFDGSVIGWASNFGVLDGSYADIYLVRLDVGPTPGPDAGVDLDAGALEDGGALEDAGSAGLDAAVIMRDAGERVDAGVAPPPDGCACRAGPARSAPRALALLALLALALLRRRRFLD